MKVERRDGSAERAVLVGMVVDRAVCAAVAARWDRDLFASRWSSLVAGWCVAHFRKYGAAPNRAIGGYFDAWAADARRDEATVGLVEDFLRSLNAEYDRNGDGPAPAYLLDVAGAHFTAVRARTTADAVKAHLECNEVDKADEALRAYRRVEVGAGAGVCPMADREAVRAAFDMKAYAAVVDYPDALGNFFAHVMERDCFVCFEGMAKVGKSFWLMDVVWRAIRQGRTVAMFEVGDMSQGQVLRRLGARAAGRPIYGVDYPIKIPVGITSGAPPIVEYEERLFPDDLTEREAWRALARVGGDDPKRFRLSCHSNDSISIDGIAGILEGWANDDFLPSVVILDYADNLSPVDRKLEKIDQINQTWQRMRRLSQDYHVLLVTASQTDTPSYRKRTLTRENFTGARQKNDHVTAMIGINQLPPEKEAGLYRLNMVEGRELDFDEDKCVWAASCLALANPAVLSTF